MNEHRPTRSAKAQFDRQATHYNAEWNAWSAQTLDWLLEHAAPVSTDTVLDAATGTGWTAMAFAPRVQSVVGLDVSAGMLAQARLEAEAQGLDNLTFAEGPAEALPFPDESFSLVTCRIAAHHFLSIPQFLRETMRVLKPGGRLALVDTTVPGDNPEAAQWQNRVEAMRDPSHVHNAAENEWREMTEAAGLTVETLTSAGAGITIPLSDWLVKAGCSPEQAAHVRQMFTDAPQSAKQAFFIETGPDGETRFTWPRVGLKAVRAADRVQST